MILTAALLQAAAAPQLAEPFTVMASDKPIEATTGHAAPFVRDMDGDGIWDLVVGEFGEGGGRARIYRNRGTAGEPLFKGEFSFLMAEGLAATVPSS